MSRHISIEQLDANPVGGPRHHDVDGATGGKLAETEWGEVPRKCPLLENEIRAIAMTFSPIESAYTYPRTATLPSFDQQMTAVPPGQPAAWIPSPKSTRPAFILNVSALKTLAVPNRKSQWARSKA
jgi:hypothetical protein